MSDNCSAPDRICRSAVFFSRSEASEGTAAKPQRRKTWNYRRATEFVSSRCFMERLLQRGRLYIPFRYSPSRPPGSASRSPSSRRCHLENALREVSKPRRQCPLHKRASAIGRREWNQGKAPDFQTGLWTFLRGGEWISPQCLGNLAPVTSAHTGYSQQFCSRQMLQISDHLIPGQV